MFFQKRLRLLTALHHMTSMTIGRPRPVTRQGVTQRELQVFQREARTVGARCGTDPSVILRQQSLAKRQLGAHHPDTPWDCHICLHWGGFGGQCRHILHTWSVWVIVGWHAEHWVRYKLYRGRPQQ